MTIYSAQQAHDDITALFDAYYSAKKEGASIAQNKRNEGANALVEQYVESNGERPPASVLSRLSTYLLLDNLTDSHPDKMSREEYPIMSGTQSSVRDFRYISLKDVEYGDRRGNGRRKAPFTSKDGYIGVSNSRLPERDDAIISKVNTVVDVNKLIEKANLSERQRQVISMIYIEKETQECAGKRLSITQQAVAKHHDAALTKLRRVFVEEGLFYF